MDETKPIPFFVSGQRVPDPTLDSSISVNDDRYRLNANICKQDEELLKTVSLSRGTIQLVTSNLIHEFCNTLRRLGINSRLELDRFHVALACRSGYINTDFTSGASSTSNPAAAEFDVLCELLPVGAAKRLRDCFLRVTSVSSGGTGPISDDNRTTKSLCGKDPRTKKVSPVPRSKVKKGRRDT